MSALAWPEGLRAEMALPFALWRVLDLVGGGRDADEVARLAGISVPELRRQLREAERWVGRALEQQRPVDEAVARTVTQCLLLVVGPVAELMVDEVLDDLSGPATMSGLLTGLAAELSAEQMGRFAQQLRARGLA